MIIAFILVCSFSNGFLQCVYSPHPPQQKTTPKTQKPLGNEFVGGPCESHSAPDKKKSA